MTQLVNRGGRPRKVPVPIDAKIALSIQEASDLTGLGRKFFYAAIRAREIDVAVVGKRWRILRVDLDHWLRSRFKRAEHERP